MGRLFSQELFVEHAHEGLDAAWRVIEPRALVDVLQNERPLTHARMVSRVVQVVSLSAAPACIKKTEKDDRADIEQTSTGEAQVRTSMQGVDTLHMKSPSDRRLSIRECERNPLAFVRRHNECGKVVYGDGHRCANDAATDEARHGCTSVSSLSRRKAAMARSANSRNSTAVMKAPFCAKGS